MQYWPHVEPKSGFNLIGGTRRIQIATLTLAQNEKIGSEKKLYATSDNWLYVLSGNGTAIVEHEKVDLNAGAMLLIKAGETHEIYNPGEQDLKLFSIYTPPVFQHK